MLGAMAQRTKVARASPRPAAASGPAILVVYGAAGDLTQRKLVPALYNLAREGLLCDSFALVGFARRELSDEEFRARLREDAQTWAGAHFEPSVWDSLAPRVAYVRGDFEDPEAYRRLAARLVELEREHHTGGNVLHYLATAPEYFASVVRHLAATGVLREENGRWRRVIVEKPFGRDLASARALNKELSALLGERQIYRIDHYLGKETVQNLLVFRFANGIFEPIWNRRYVDHVQITVAETLGVEKRGGYYDKAGALRDMVPNHIFQLISLVAMEPPISFQADAVRDEQTKALRAIQPMEPSEVLADTVRGQYAAGTAGGRRLPDYRAEELVDSASSTETFVALRLALDNWRWSDVPFYVRVGKALAARRTEVAIQFKRPPLVLFRDTPVEHLTPNQLVISLQPDEQISLSFSAKIPGPNVQLGNVDMDFSYAEQFGGAPATGYERLLHDALVGDPTLFQRKDTVEAAWSAVEPVLDVWGALPPRDFPNYRAGSWGPEAADELLARDGRAWRAMQE
jgi:glucose-6-phosphate 1-dehydrogenase